MAHMFTPQLKLKQLEININLPDQDFWVEGDPARLTQIITNLLSNAVKFTSSLGKISITMTYQPISESNNDVMLAVSVQDTGIGMTLEEQQQLFSEFSQASERISAQYGGSGLGLAISKKLVELLGGKISVRSEKDKGTQFDFTVRCKHLRLEKKPIAVDISPDLVSMVTPKNILVVDDNPINQKILVKYLQQVGHHY